MLCTSFSQQQVYQPVPRKLDCCYFSGFRVLKLYFKPTVNDFTVLLFHEPLITGTDRLFDAMECLQTVLSVHLAPLHIQAGGGASAGQDRTGKSRTGWPQFQPVDLAFLCLPLQPTSGGSAAQKYTHIRILFCSGGGNQTIYQQFSSSTNHSPVKKFYWTQQFKNIAWIQRAKVLLLSPLFPWAGKNPHHLPHQKLGEKEGGREGKLINTLRQAIQTLGLQSSSFITLFFASLSTGHNL